MRKKLSYFDKNLHRLSTLPQPLVAPCFNAILGWFYAKHLNFCIKIKIFVWAISQKNQQILQILRTFLILFVKFVTFYNRNLRAYEMSGVLFTHDKMWVLLKNEMWEFDFLKVFDVNMSGIFKILKFDKKCFILNLKFELVLGYKILTKNAIVEMKNAKEAPERQP